VTTASGRGDVVTLREEESVNISCNSTGIPVPTITWTLRNETTPFNQTDLSTDVMGDVIPKNNALVSDINDGKVESTLHIEHAQYPAHHGVYQCTGSNSHAGVAFTSTANIRVRVIGMSCSFHGDQVL